MPRINESERRLATVLGIVVFLAANVVGYFVIDGMMKGLAAQKSQLDLRLRELQESKDKAVEADVKSTWMDAHFKTYPNDEFRETYLDSLVNSDLTAGLDVELSKPSVLQTDTTGEFCVRSRFRVTVKGPWNDVYKFIYRLQKPEEFRFVPQITMTPKKAESDDSVQVVEVQLTIEKWWQRPEGDTASPEMLVQDEQTGDSAIKDSGAPGASSEGAATPSPVPAPAENPEKPAADPAPAPAPVTPPSETDSPKPNP